MAIKIKNRRLLKGLTQQELADICGCSRQYINQIEVDGETNVSSKLLVKIAEALDCTMDDIFFKDIGYSDGQVEIIDYSRSDG